MPAALEFPGQVKNGQLPRALLEQLGGVARRLDGKWVIVSIRERKRTRSGQQNKYYWSVVVEAVTQMFRDAGNYVDPEEVHDFLKLHVGKLSQVLVTPDGEVIKSLGSTTKLSTQEFEVYLERIRAWAAEFGLAIPLPHENLNP